ncbi:glycoside hydrolase family 31 protein [Draconibacterium sp. IB214405]|uniref:TIM-barrel domain-containing protein n=1 Tax=Draconibacterium sp. IB214405 TaxID=3097352 RepID=UPI002A16EE87|nr:TIM-barrel domain-containing protein [Draconibacterium sp. IB214405]MDX8339638.1 glycoside hydrolase family 31 protein [Draconibacterium sp. IB214405]
MRIFKSGLILFLLSGVCNVVLGQKSEQFPFINENYKSFQFCNKEAKLIISKETGQIQVAGNDGKIHYSEYRKPSFLINDQWVTPNDFKILETVDNNKVVLSVLPTKEYQIKLSIERASTYGFSLKYYLDEGNFSEIKGTVKLNPVEEIYGFGESWNGHLAQRGQKIKIWDKGGTPDECAWMPYFVSTNNYTFSIDYGGEVNFDVGQLKSDELTFDLSASELSYTILIGENLASSVQNFVALHGMPSKPPRWSFEPWFWLMSDPDIPDGRPSTLRGYQNLEMVKKLKEMNIPVGVTWFEPPWQDARTSFIPNTEFTPDLKGLIKELDDLGVKTLAWTVPYTNPEASNYAEAVEKRYLVRKANSERDKGKVKISKSGELAGTYYNFIDYFNPEASTWWQKQIEQAIDLGLKGFKLDAGQGLPNDAILYEGREGKDVHNSYALEYNRVFHEVLSKKMGDDFLMIPRAAWIGSWAQTNSKWPGDLSASFAANGLPSSVLSSLSLSFSGIPFVSTDIGGFEGRPSPDNVWIRWAQFGAFLPGMQTLNMPWWYPEELMDHFRYLAWLHTDLIPYWETLANLAHKDGTPICKPLVFDYQKDQNTWRVENEFTVGEYILVAPFTDERPYRDVYLPEGTWFDFWNEDVKYDGKTTLNWGDEEFTRKWEFPVFVKEGAVIPLEIKNDVIGFGNEYSSEFITLAIWPEAEAENKFILNDREGEVPIVTNWKNKNELKISWTDSSKDYLLRVHLSENITPEKIYSGNQQLQYSNSYEAFCKAKSNVCFFDGESNNLWVKAINKKNIGLIKVELK